MLLASQFARRAAFGAASALLAGCVLGDFQKGGGAAGGGGAGGDGGGGSGGAPPSCTPKKPPGTIPPDDPTAALPPLVMAVRSVNFGEKGLSIGSDPSANQVAPGYVPVGYDLDGRCTCVEGVGPAGNPGCATPTFIMPGKQNNCDFEGGVDNQFSWFIAKASSLLSSIGSDAYSDFAEQGLWSLVVRISGFTGQPDDRVQVRIYNTLGPADCTHDPAMGWPPPKVPLGWTGLDCWSVSTESFVAPTPLDQDPVDDTLLDAGARYFDLAAYVTDGVLVASLPEAGIQLSGGDGSLAVKLKGGVFTAELVEGPYGWGIQNGLIAGAWALDDLFTALGDFKASLAGNPIAICTDTAYYGSIKQEICNLTESLSQNLAPSAPCDAISFGLGFTAEPAAIYPFVRENPLAPAACPDATNPKFDSCDAP